MSQDVTLTRFAVKAQLDEVDVQNSQELASLWGTIRGEAEELGIDIHSIDAVIGEFDFLLIVEVPSGDDVVKLSVLMQRHGLDVKTMPLVPEEQFANLVVDV